MKQNSFLMKSTQEDQKAFIKHFKLPQWPPRKIFLFPILKSYLVIESWCDSDKGRSPDWAESLDYLPVNLSRCICCKLVWNRIMMANFHVYSWCLILYLHVNHLEQVCRLICISSKSLIKIVCKSLFMHSRK